MEHLTVRVPSGLKREIQRQAQASGRSVSDVVRQRLEGPEDRSDELAVLQQRLDRLEEMARGY
jgi:Arc/MetJ-type ribon-helix-helix transcriptional regulator